MLTRIGKMYSKRWLSKNILNRFTKSKFLVEGRISERFANCILLPIPPGAWFNGTYQTRIPNTDERTKATIKSSDVIFLNENDSVEIIVLSVYFQPGLFLCSTIIDDGASWFVQYLGQ